MQIQSIIPILYSDDINRSLTYYTEVLGFEEKWTWDDPLTFGSVSHGKENRSTALATINLMCIY